MIIHFPILPILKLQLQHEQPSRNNQKQPTLLLQCRETMRIIQCLECNKHPKDIYHQYRPTGDVLPRSQGNFYASYFYPNACTPTIAT